MADDIDRSETERSRHGHLSGHSVTRRRDRKYGRDFGIADDSGRVNN